MNNRLAAKLLWYKNTQLAKDAGCVRRAYFRRNNIAKKFQRAVYQRPTTITCNTDRLNAPNGDYIGSVVIWTEKQK